MFSTGLDLVWEFPPQDQERGQKEDFPMQYTHPLSGLGLAVAQM